MIFSQRIGIIKVKNIIQKNFINIALRNCIYNVYIENFSSTISACSEPFEINLYEFYFYIYKNFWKKPLDEIPAICNNIIYLKDYINTIEWYKLYDFMEYTIIFIKNYKNGLFYERFVGQINEVLKKENSAYRIIDGIVVPIVDDVEIEAIQESLYYKDFKGIEDQIFSALQKLSDRKNPDYRNSIKESISAVETLIRNLTGKNTLGDGIKELKNKQHIDIPDILILGLEKLYAYTNNKDDGIRHALMDDYNNVNFEEAKFMLVACCNFINYIKIKIKDK